MGVGKSKSTNILENYIDQSIKFMESTTQSCYVSANNNINWKIRAKGNVDISNMNFSQVVGLDNKCLQDTTSNTTILNQMENSAKQAASATVGAMPVGLNDAEANNITKNYINVAEEVRKAFAQTCSNSGDNNATFDIDGGGDVKLGYVNLDQAQTGMAECVQKVVSNSDVVQKTKNDNNQSAVSETKGLLDFLNSWILILIIIILAIVFVGYKTVSGAASAMTNVKIIAGVIMVVCGVMIGLFFAKKWPYEDSGISDDDSDKASKKKKNYIKLGIFCGGFVFSLIFLIYAMKKGSYSGASPAAVAAAKRWTQMRGRRW